MRTRETKPLPCPFCGGDAEMDTQRGYVTMGARSRVDSAVAIYCTQCSADMSLCRADHPGVDTEELVSEISEAWNKRAMPLQDHARPASEYDPSMGSVLWWKFPISEPPYVGSPDDCGFTVEAHTTTRLITQMDQDHDPETTIHRIHAGGWPGYHTHFTLITMPAAPAMVAEDRVEGK